MVAPTFGQLAAPSSTGPGLTQETVLDRILTCVAMLASGMNPDGTGGANYLPVIPGIQTGSMPADGGTANRIAIQSFVNAYGMGLLPYGDIYIDQAIILALSGQGLAGWAPTTVRSGQLPSPNKVVSRLLPGTNFTTFGPTASKTQRTDTVCNLTNGSTTLTDSTLTAADVGYQVIDTNVPAGTYLTAVTTAFFTFSAVASGGGGPTTVTSSVTGLANGMGVRITGGTGSWTPINAVWQVSNVTGTTFTITLDSSTFGAFTSTLPRVHTATGTMTNAATATVSNESVVIGASIYYSLIQLGDDNAAAGNWIRNLVTDGQSVVQSSVYNGSSLATVDSCFLNGGLNWCFENSTVGGNAAATGGPGHNTLLFNTCTDNIANFQTASTPGGCFKAYGGQFTLHGGSHTNGYKLLHSANMQAEDSFWLLDDSTVAAGVPHVDVKINAKLVNVSIQGTQAIALIRRNTRPSGTDPIFLDLAACTLSNPSSGTQGIPMISDLQPAAQQFDPITIDACEIISNVLSSNGHGVSPFSAIVDDPRATYITNLAVDGSTVALFGTATTSFTESTVIPSNPGTFPTTLAVSASCPPLYNGQTITVSDGTNTQNFTTAAVYAGGAGNVTMTGGQTVTTITGGSGYTCTAGAAFAVGSVTDGGVQWPTSVVGAQIAASGTGNNPSFATIVSVSSTAGSTNNRLNGSLNYVSGSSMWTNGTPNKTATPQYWVSQLLAPKITDLFGGGFSPAYVRGLTYYNANTTSVPACSGSSGQAVATTTTTNGFLAVFPGMVVSDSTTPANISAGTVVLSVQSSTSITLSQNIATTLSSDTLVFGSGPNPVSLTAAATIAAGYNPVTAPLSGSSAACSGAAGQRIVTTSVSNGFLGVVPGMIVTDMTTAANVTLGTTVAAVISTSALLLSANLVGTLAPDTLVFSGSALSLTTGMVALASDNSGSVLTCSGSTSNKILTTTVANGFAGLFPGMTITDSTTAGNISAGTTIASIQSSMSLTMSAVAGGNFTATDTIAFAIKAAAANQMLTSPILQPGRYRVTISTSITGMAAAGNIDFYIAPSVISGAAAIDANWGTTSRCIATTTQNLGLFWSGPVVVTQAGAIDMVIFLNTTITGTVLTKALQSNGSSGMAGKTQMSWELIG